MESFDSNIRILEMQKSIDEVKESVSLLLKTVQPEEDLWDNSDLIRNWKVSERTLATWRKNKIISYIQVGSKIWYPKLAREEFLFKNLVDNDKDLDSKEFEISPN